MSVERDAINVSQLYRPSFSALPRDCVQSPERINMETSKKKSINFIMDLVICVKTNQNAFACVCVLYSILNYMSQRLVLRLSNERLPMLHMSEAPYTM